MKPEEITPQNALALARNSNWRRKYRAAVRQEVFEAWLGKKSQESIWWRWDKVARECEATPEELREVALMLLRRRRQRDGLLIPLFFHWLMPEDVFEHIIEMVKVDAEPEYLSYIFWLCHRKLPRHLLERLAGKFDQTERVDVYIPIFTLAYEYGLDEEVSDEFFRDFLVQHQDSFNLGNSQSHVLHLFSPTKQAIVRDVLGHRLHSWA